MPEIFINYRTNDAHDTAAAIQLDLSRRFGSERVFFAGKTIKPGTDYRRELLRAVRTSRVLIAVIGPRWLAPDARGHSPLESPDDWIRREIAEAFEAGVHVVPVLAGREVQRLSATDLPEDIRQLAYCQSRRYDHRDAEDQMARLSRDLIDLIPNLVGLPAANPDRADGNGTLNSIRDTTVHGPVNQSRDHVHNQSGGNSTVVNDPRGPVNTGSGHQYNQPHRESETGGTRDEET